MRRVPAGGAYGHPGRGAERGRDGKREQVGTQRPADRGGTTPPPVPAALVGHGHRMPGVGPGRAVEVLQHGRVDAVRRLRPGFRRRQPGGPGQHVAQGGQVHGGQPDR